MGKPRFVQEGIREGKPWWVVETAHYILMFDKVSRKIFEPAKFARQAERRLGRIAGLLRLSKSKDTNRYPLEPSIPYFVHDPAVCKWGSVNHRGIDVPAGRKDTFYRHEETHVILSRAIGTPPPLFNEGFAMYAKSPRSMDNHKKALAAVERNALPTIGRIADFESFFLKEWKTHKDIMYPQAGSFVQFIFERLGYRKFVTLCRALCCEDPARRVHRIFREIYGNSLSEAEAMWKSYLLHNRKRFRQKLK